MKKLVLMLFLFSAFASAQVPAPFVGLLTNQTDYSAGYLTSPWYTPNATAGQPGTYSGPAYSGSLTDPIFGTTYLRPPRPTNCAANAPCNGPQGINVIYSKLDPFSRNSSKMMVEDDTGWLQLYDVSTTPATYIGRPQINPATNAFATDGNDLATDYSNWTWCKALGCGNKVYYTGQSSATSGRNQLKLADPAANTAVVVHDFTSVIASFPGCQNVDDRREGNQSDDDRYWFFDCVDNNGRDYGVFTYDRTTDTVVAQKSMAAGGICGVAACDPLGANWTGVSPTGTYFLINWNQFANNPQSLTRGRGTEIFDKNLTFLGWADDQNSHADVGVTKDGKEVYVTVPYGASRYDYNAIAITDLSNLSTSIPTGFKWAPGERTVGLPCNYNYTPTAPCPLNGTFRAQSYTISMRGSHGAAQGAMMLSNFAPQSTPDGAGGWGANENDIIMLNYATAYTTPGDGNPVPVGEFYRVGRTHDVHALSKGGSDIGDYFAQADGTCNWDCSKVAWSSTGDIDNGSADGGTTPNVPDSALPVGQPRRMVLYAALPISGGGSPVTGNTNMELDTDWLQPGNVGNTGGGSAAPHGTYTQTPGNPATWSIVPASTPYDTFFFYRQLATPGDAFNRYTYSLDVQYPTTADLNASQAWEFETQQNTGNTVYNCGWQADIKGSGFWRYFNYTTSTWVPTSIPVSTSTFPAGTWVTVSAQCTRSAGSITFDTLTVAGTTYNINATLAGFPKTETGPASYINAGFQLDSNGLATPTPYTMKTRNMNTTQTTFTPAPTISSIAIALSPASTFVGGTSSVVCTTTFSDGTHPACSGTLNSASTSVATASGLTLTAVGTGTSAITYTQGGVTSNTATLTVATPSLQSISITLTPSSILVGGTATVTCTTTWTDGTHPACAGSLSSSAVSVASVSGLTLTGVGVGSATIRYVQGAVQSNALTLSVSSPASPTATPFGGNILIGMGLIMPWIKIANEGETRTIPAAMVITGQMMRYGQGSKWVYQPAVAGNVTASQAFFGAEPGPKGTNELDLQGVFLGVK